MRQNRVDDIHPIIVSTRPPRVPAKNFGSPYILLGGFVLLIIIGTILLSFPFTNHDNEITPVGISLFTATSAATVTGLIVVDTSSYWTVWGQLIIMLLILVGGLGIMTSATFLLIIIGQRITLANRLLMRESLGVNRLEGLVPLTIRIILVVLLMELVGFVVLFGSMSQYFPPGEAAWQALFHSISGFNNAGFIIFPHGDGLSQFQNDFMVLVPLMVLIVLGTLSYSVLVDIFRYRRFTRYTLDTKLVIFVTLGLTILGTLVLLISEYNNDATMGDMPVAAKVFHSLFHSVSGRTAGFTTINFGDMEQHSNFFLTGLMFIGGASASTAGGIKVNTLAVLMVAVLASLRGDTHVTAFGRELPQPQIFRALAILMLGITVVFTVSFLLTITESFPFINILFETVSAFGTVGLSTGITSELSSIGKIIIVFTMLLGRVGPLTLALTLAQREKINPYRFAEERVKIG